MLQLLARFFYLKNSAVGVLLETLLTTVLQFCKSFCCCVCCCLIGSVCGQLILFYCIAEMFLCLEVNTLDPHSSLTIKQQPDQLPQIMGKKQVLVKVQPEGKYVVDLDKSIEIAKVVQGARVTLRNDSYQLHLLLPTKVSTAARFWLTSGTRGWLPAVRYLSWW